MLFQPFANACHSSLIGLGSWVGPMVYSDLPVVRPRALPISMLQDESPYNSGAAGYRPVSRAQFCVASRFGEVWQFYHLVWIYGYRIEPEGEIRILLYGHQRLAYLLGKGRWMELGGDA